MLPTLFHIIQQQTFSGIYSYPYSALCQRVIPVFLHPLKFWRLRAEFGPNELSSPGVELVGRFLSGDRIYRALIKLCFCKEQNLILLCGVCKCTGFFLRPTKGPSTSSGQLLLLPWALICLTKVNSCSTGNCPSKGMNAVVPGKWLRAWKSHQFQGKTEAFVPQGHWHQCNVFWQSEEKKHTSFQLSFLGNCSFCRSALIAFDWLFFWLFFDYFFDWLLFFYPFGEAMIDLKGKKKTL